MSYGHDYGRGQTNIDHETEIRYGVIPQNDVLQSWADSADSDYGEPHCPKCGNEAHPIDDAPDEYGDNPEWEDNGGDYCCPSCRYTFEQEEAFGEDPVAWILDDGEYHATQSGDDADIFIFKSPYFTYAQYCSPCAPGACYLRNPVDTNGPRAYCFAPDWFDYWEHEGHGPELTGEFEGQKTSCPYPVYRVSDGECVFMPNRADDTPRKPR